MYNIINKGVFGSMRIKPAAGGFRFSPLHSRAALRSATLHQSAFWRITFRSLSAPALATHARVFPSSHCAQAYPHPPSGGFHFVPLSLSNPQSGTQSQNGKLHSTRLNSLHCIQSPPLLSPTQSTACPAKCSPLKTKNHKSLATL